jgi:hypothetical protein
MEPLTAEAELDDKLRNGVMSLARELSVLCGPGFSAAVEQPAGIAEHVPSTVAILASSPWSKGYAPHCKLTPPGPKVKVSRKSSVYFLLNVHPFDIECKKDCGHMLPSMEHHRCMIAPTKEHRKKGVERLTGDDRVTVPRGLPYLMLGRQVRRFAPGASRPAAAEVEEALCPHPPGLDVDEEFEDEPLEPACAAVECQVDSASPDENDDERIGGEEPQALAAEPQAEAKSQEALEDKVLPPLVEAEPPRAIYP